jgi:Ca2+-binding RTX toxin-like protein
MPWNGALRFRLSAVLANDLLDGGEGDDRLEGGEGSDLLIGGKGADSLDAGSGANVVLHNRGDGSDVLKPTGTRMTLSVGGGVAYEDLALRKVGNDLVLETGSEEGVTLDEWYDPAVAKPQYLTLQTITQAMAAFDAASVDPLLNKKVQQFDLRQLAQGYDQARAADPTVDRWAVMNALLDARLAAADSEALGGDLAYQYGMTGSLAGIGVSAAQQVLNTGQFGNQAQALRPAADLQQGQVRLA